MKHTKKKILTLASIACFGMAVLCTPASTLIAEAATPPTETVSPCADIIGWRYKEENGKLYRRLYNYTIAAWVSEWEYVGDL